MIVVDFEQVHSRIITVDFWSISSIDQPILCKQFNDHKPQQPPPTAPIRRRQ